MELDGLMVRQLMGQAAEDYKNGAGARLEAALALWEED